MMDKLNDILEACLRDLDQQQTLESILEHYPDQADELRPLISAALLARELTPPQASAKVIQRGRARFMERAALLREQKKVRRARTLPVFNRLAISFVLTLVLLLSGTGLVRASSSALPGENLYPVKRSWEGLRLFFTLDGDQRVHLENEFESERLEEVSELIAEGRHETIQFAGVFMELKSSMYVAGVPILITENTQLPDRILENGAAVMVSGRTNSDGYVEVDWIIILPEGSTVPVGIPVESESESDSDGESNSTTSENGSGSQDGESEEQESRFQYEGTITSLSGDEVEINGRLGNLAGARIDGRIAPGVSVEVEGYYSSDGKFIITRIKVRQPSSGSGVRPEGSDDNSNSGSGGGSDRDDDDDDDHSGPGGGGDDDDDD